MATRRRLKPPVREFRSPRGRRFSVGAGAREETRAGDPFWSERWPILYRGKPAGKLFRDDVYARSSSGPRYHASTRELYWSYAADAPTGIGFDVGPSDSADSTLREWSRSADEILDWSEGKEIRSPYSKTGRYQKNVRRRSVDRDARRSSHTSRPRDRAEMYLRDRLTREYDASFADRAMCWLESDRFGRTLLAGPRPKVNAVMRYIGDNQYLITSSRRTEDRDPRGLRFYVERSRLGPSAVLINRRGRSVNVINGEPQDSDEDARRAARRHWPEAREVARPTLSEHRRVKHLASRPRRRDPAPSQLFRSRPSREQQARELDHWRERGRRDGERDRARGVQEPIFARIDGRIEAISIQARPTISSVTAAGRSYLQAYESALAGRSRRRPTRSSGRDPQAYSAGAARARASSRPPPHRRTHTSSRDPRSYDEYEDAVVTALVRKGWSRAAADQAVLREFQGNVRRGWGGRDGKNPVAVATEIDRYENYVKRTGSRRRGPY